MRFFLTDVLPLIRRTRPECSVTIVGRKPTAEIATLARHAGKVHVTGTVDDVRPYLWGARVSIVPLRIGGGTRLKIYESMAAGTPVVSTRIGAEGLDVSHPLTIRLADTPEAFADECLMLLDNHDERDRMAVEAQKFVSSRFSWEHVVTEFESLLHVTPRFTSRQ